MRHLLTTLEGDFPRSVPQRRSTWSEPLLGQDETFQAQLCGSLGLSGWLSDIGSYTSKKITQAKDSNIPGVSQLAAGVREGGNALTTIGSSVQVNSSGVTMTPAQYAATHQDNTTLYIALAVAVGLVLVMKGK